MEITVVRDSKKTIREIKVVIPEELISEFTNGVKVMSMVKSGNFDRNNLIKATTIDDITYASIVVWLDENSITDEFDFLFNNDQSQAHSSGIGWLWDSTEDVVGELIKISLTIVSNEGETKTVVFE